ncbi:hypothetical protein EDB89DRAFT_2204289, partial [Lactarius sanguifluus]
MNSSNTPTSRLDMMTPYLHFTGGDNLFKSWRPSSNGAVAASIALMALAVSERFLFSIRGAMEARWRRRHTFFYEAGNERGRCLRGRYDRKQRRTITPFVFSHDAARGALYSLQALLTFQAAYIISVVIGLGLGEVSFERIAST